MRFHSYSLSRTFSNQCVSVNTLSLSRTDTVISRSGSPHDASHLTSIIKRRAPSPPISHAMYKLTRDELLLRPQLSYVETECYLKLSKAT